MIAEKDIIYTTPDTKTKYVKRIKKHLHMYIYIVAEIGLFVNIFKDRMLSDGM